MIQLITVSFVVLFILMGPGSLRISYTELLFFSKISLILWISTGYLISWSCSICSFELEKIYHIAQRILQGILYTTLSGHSLIVLIANQNFEAYERKTLEILWRFF